MLCDVCESVIRDRANLITDQPGDDGPMVLCAHHRTSKTLEQSAAQCCYVCSNFWNQLSITEQEALRTEEARVALARVEVQNAQVEEEDLFEWLTFTILQKGNVVGDDFSLILTFSGDGIDWKRVSSRDPIALGIYVLKISGSEYTFTFTIGNSYLIIMAR